MGVEKQFTALWQYRYNLLNIKLAYMLNYPTSTRNMT